VHYCIWRPVGGDRVQFSSISLASNPALSRDDVSVILCLAVLLELRLVKHRHATAAYAELA